MQESLRILIALGTTDPAFNQIARTDAQRRWPEGFWGVTTPSGVLQSQVVVYSLVEFLLEAKIALSCRNRCVPRQILNLLKFSAARQMA